VRKIDIDDGNVTTIVEEYGGLGASLGIVFDPLRSALYVPVSCWNTFFFQPLIQTIFDKTIPFCWHTFFLSTFDPNYIPQDYSLSANLQVRSACDIRKVDLWDNSVTTIAGNGNCASKDDIDGSFAEFYNPVYVFLTSDAQILYVAVSYTICSVPLSLILCLPHATLLKSF